jgi:hypothetical protein
MCADIVVNFGCGGCGGVVARDRARCCCCVRRLCSSDPLSMSASFDPPPPAAIVVAAAASGVVAGSLPITVPICTGNCPY